MAEERMKKILSRSIKLAIIIVVLTWLDFFFCRLADNHPFIEFYTVFFPAAISIAAILLTLLLYFHRRSLSHCFLNLNARAAAAEYAASARDKLYDNIGHDLRTPLIGILGAADLLGQSRLTPEQGSNVDTITVCGRELLTIIDQLIATTADRTDPACANRESGPLWASAGGYEIESEDPGSLYLFNHFLPVRILVVEDNDLNSKLIQQMLINYGFETEVAGDGLECLQKLQEKEFHLVLMDMQMPVLDGYETTRKIRANSDYDHIPVIAITANTLSYDLDRCFSCGCSGYLPKPFGAEELAAEIKLHLKIDSGCIRKSNLSPSSDDLINQLLPEFIDIMAEMLGELHTAAATQDLATIQDLSHAIKGTAGMYGFTLISEIAALIEQAVRQENYASIPGLITRLDHCYQQTLARRNSNIVG